MKNSDNLLAIYLMIGALVCANATGQPYTSAMVSGDAYAGSYSQSNSDSANGSTSGDFSSGYSQWNSRAQANSMFGFNSLYAQTSYAYAVGYGNPSYGNSPSASASYTFDWSTGGGSQSGTIINVNLGLGGSLNGEYVGSFSFVYGTQYNMQSLMIVNSSFPYTSGQANSIWDDTFTFSGQPNGTVGTAMFTISLAGSIFEQDTQYSEGGMNFDQVTLTANFDNGAALSSIDLPPDTTIEASSGTIYGTPEPSTFALIAVGLGGIWLYRSRRKSSSIFHKSV
jgi:hypothetical protein